MPGRFETQFLKLREAGSASDFPNILGNEMHKMALPSYAAVKTTWEKWCSTEPNIQDFKENYRIATSETEDLEEVLPGHPAKESTFDESRTNYKIKKFEKVFGIPWELLINDDIGAIKQQPQRWYRSAARTIAKFAVAFLTGRSASSAVTGALGETTLAAAINEFKKRTDSKTSEILGIAPKYLVVPPDLEITGKKILNSTNLIAIGVGSTAAVQGSYNAVNKAESGLELLVEPFLTDPNNWYLVAEPADVPGIEIGFFRGGRQPRVFVKSASIQGNDNPFDHGDFETGSIMYKIQHIYGGQRIDDNAILKVQVSG
jgi:hypothetical protein